MQNKVRISSVSYTNMAPFIYGLQHAPIIEEIDLSFDVPSMCAEKLIHRRADIGIVPVAALLQIPDYKIISNYCLGAYGEVDSVFIFSEKPIEEIRSIRLDDQSRTSNGLARLLLREYWKRDDVVIRTQGEADAFVQIGDRTFGQKDVHAYAYDLASYWLMHTGLPFAFAVWVQVNPLPEGFIDRFNQALANGLENKDAVIATLPKRADFDYGKYLRQNIDYRFDEGKKQAVDRYLAWLRTAEAVVFDP